jgi:dTDP-D-glucose 4,6-dehydratase
VEKAARVLNWRAQMTFEEGLRRTIQWFREHQREIK